MSSVHQRPLRIAPAAAWCNACWAARTGVAYSVYARRRSSSHWARPIPRRYGPWWAGVC